MLNKPWVSYPVEANINLGGWGDMQRDFGRESQQIYFSSNNISKLTIVKKAPGPQQNSL
jgi:hypothetical protein